MGMMTDVEYLQKQLNVKNKEIERLRKEKEWLLLGYIDRYEDYVLYRKGNREVILKLMQQALKDTI